MNHMTPYRHIMRRGGFTVTELIVAATLLVTIMTVATPLTVRSNRMRQDTRHHRLAIDELSNQLERLVCLRQPQLARALEELSPSPHIKATLPHPEISAEVVADAGGVRLALHLSWDRIGANSPVTLVGWIDPLPSSSTPTAQEESP